MKREDKMSRNHNYYGKLSLILVTVLIASFFFIFPNLAGAQIQGGITYYVDANIGNDDNPGTIDQPWKTIAFAIQQLQPGNILYLRGERNLDRLTGWKPTILLLRVVGRRRRSRAASYARNRLAKSSPSCVPCSICVRVHTPIFKIHWNSSGR